MAAILKAQAEQTSARSVVAEGIDVYLAAMRSGELFVAGWKERLVMAGLGNFIQVGALTTPIQGGGAGTILDLDQPEVNIGVPTGTTIIPIRIHIQAEVPADQDADIQEIVVGYDRLATNGGGTFTDETVYNMRTGISSSSACDANSAYSANQTTEPTLIEVARAQTVTNIVTSGITNTLFELLYEPEIPLFLVGPCQLLCYWGGVQAMSAFAQVFWLEVPTTAFA